MKDIVDKFNIRYLGFESVADGGRRLDYSITGPGRTATRASCAIPGRAFSGANRITFQESAAVCYEKLRAIVEREEEIQDGLHFRLSEQDIETFRPRRRKAVVRNKI